jgi:enediyne biosynthesis protein CalE5
MSDKLMSMAEIKRGSVLDIATSIGKPAITVARSKRTNGHVLATDISVQMLSIARQRAISEHLEGIIDFKDGDAATIDLPQSSFEAVLCRPGLIFLEEINIVLFNIYKSLVDDRCFAAIVWATSEKVPRLALAIDTLRKKLNITSSSSSSPPRRTPGPFSLAD